MVCPEFSSEMLKTWVSEDMEPVRELGLIALHVKPTLLAANVLGSHTNAEVESGVTLLAEKCPLSSVSFSVDSPSMLALALSRKAHRFARRWSSLTAVSSRSASATMAHT